jgi:hypothetical protein
MARLADLGRCADRPRLQLLALCPRDSILALRRAVENGPIALIAQHISASETTWSHFVDLRVRDSQAPPRNTVSIREVMGYTRT